jgi:hypothetical protein
MMGWQACFQSFLVQQLLQHCALPSSLHIVVRKDTANILHVSSAQSTTPRSLQQQLDQAYRDAKLPQQKSPAELRKQKRREYMAKVGKRNDSSFFASIGALVLIPPLAILGFAIATGYIDIFNP